MDRQSWATHLHVRRSHVPPPRPSRRVAPRASAGASVFSSRLPVIPEQLLDGDDWSFVIKAQALVEGSVTQAVLAHISGKGDAAICHARFSACLVLPAPS